MKSSPVIRLPAISHLQLDEEFYYSRFRRRTEEYLTRPTIHDPFLEQYRISWWFHGRNEGFSRNGCAKNYYAAKVLRLGSGKSENFWMMNSAIEEPRENHINCRESRPEKFLSLEPPAQDRNRALSRCVARFEPAVDENYVQKSLRLHIVCELFEEAVLQLPPMILPFRHKRSLRVVIAEVGLALTISFPPRRFSPESHRITVCSEQMLQRPASQHETTRRRRQNVC